MRRKRKIGAVLLPIIIAWIISAAAALAVTDRGNAAAAGGGVTMSVTYGFYNQARYGRCFNLYVSVTSHKAAVDGILKAVFHTGETDTIEYETPASAETGERKTYAIPVAAYTTVDRIDVTLLDQAGKTVVECTVTPDILNYGRNMLIGVISDRAGEYGYLEYLGGQVIYLNQESLPADVYGYDMLDMVIIDQFDSANLKASDRSVLTEWARRGGTLVFGTGENALASYEEFQDEFGTAEISARYDSEIGFESDGTEREQICTIIMEFEEIRKNQIIGMNSMNHYTTDSNGYSTVVTEIGSAGSGQKEEDDGSEQILFGNYIAASMLGEKDLESFTAEPLQRTAVKLNLSGYQAVAGLKGGPSLYKKSVGDGTVLISGISLAVSEEETDSENLVIYALGSQIKENLDEARENKLQQELYGSGGVDYRVTSSVDLVDESKVPRVGKYAVLLTGYVILIGPVLYLFLRKRDKSIHIWWILPAGAVLFTLVVYAMGSKTRISEPYVSYVDMVEYDENGKAQGTVYFNVTVPSSRRVNVSVNSDTPLVEIRRGRTPDYYTGQDLSMRGTREYPTTQQYNNTVIESGGGAELTLDMYPAFTKAVYMSQYSTETGSKLLEGRENENKNSVTVTAEGLTGTVTNNTRYGLTDAMFVGEQFLYNVGSMESGESRQLDGLQSVFMATKNLVDSNPILDDVSESKEKRPSNQAIRKSQLIRYFLENHGYKDGQSWLVGFSSEVGEQNPLEGYLAAKGGTGMTVVALPVEISGRNGETEFVSDMDGYMDIVEGNYDDSYHYRYLGSDELTVDYDFPETEKITSVIYTGIRNPEYSDEFDTGYKGSVYFYNWQTAQYELAFADNIPGRVTGLSSYLNGENTLRVKYKTGNTPYSSTYMTLPYLSYEKEAVQ